MTRVIQPMISALMAANASRLTLVGFSTDFLDYEIGVSQSL